jgi:hypothetical protein
MAFQEDPEQAIEITCGATKTTASEWDQHHCIQLNISVRTNGPRAMYWQGADLQPFCSLGEARAELWIQPGWRTFLVEGESCFLVEDVQLKSYWPLSTVAFQCSDRLRRLGDIARNHVMITNRRIAPRVGRQINRVEGKISSVYLMESGESANNRKNSSSNTSHIARLPASGRTFSSPGM